MYSTSGSPEAARKNHFSFAIIEMSFKEMGPELLATWRGSVSIDQTTVRAASRRGFARGESKDPKLDSIVLEPDANWAVKSPKRRGEEGSDHHGEATWGFMANFATMVAENPFKASPHPSLIAAMTLSTPARNVGGEAIELLRQLQEAKYPAGHVTTDKEYAANMLPENYALPLRALGYTIVTDYQKDRLGVQGHQRGALILDGKHKCPAIPAKLKTYNEKYVNGLVFDEDDDADDYETAGSGKSKEQRIAELEAHDRLYRDSAMYNFKQHEGPDSTGAVKMSCPARGKSATASCRLVTPGVRTEGKDRVPVLNPPANPPECCRLEVLTMPVTEEWRYLQELEYQSPAWRRTYKTDRNLVELSNSLIKDEGAEALADSGRRRLRGLTAQQVLVTFLVVNANMRRIYAFRDAAELTEKQRPDRKPRKRDSLSLRNYDVRIAEVREAQGLAPLEGSRKKASKLS
jgi:hypothetical protein